MRYFLFLVFLNSMGQAATLECETLVNLDVVTSGSVSPVKNVKLKVSEVPEVSAFVTETGPESYLVEAYLPSLQMRIYAEGSLRSLSEKLTASAWDRSLMVDVVCKKIK